MWGCVGEVYINVTKRSWSFFQREEEGVEKGGGERERVKEDKVYMNHTRSENG